ncbi:MAG: hypothetical protein M1839_007124 [Geoglossum umbratile]|nr:MAG: hypothetical protein M1839_007124 [Geoglossum umbratile]
MSVSPSSFAARARRAEQEAARSLEAVNPDRSNHNSNSPGLASHSPYTKFTRATKTKGAKAWLPFDLFADTEPTEGDSAAGSSRELPGPGGVASLEASQKAITAVNEYARNLLQGHVKSPEPSETPSKSLKWSVDAQFDVEEWDPNLPPGPEDPTTLETLPLAPKLIDFSGLGPANKPHISAQPPTNGSDQKRENQVAQVPRLLGLPFSYPEDARMHHFGSGTLHSSLQQPQILEVERRVGIEEAVKWPASSRKAITMRVPVPKQQAQVETLAAQSAQSYTQPEGPRYHTQEETLAALGVQPPMQSDQARGAAPSRLTHDQILSNLFTVEDLLKEDKIEEEMQVRGMNMSVRGIETVQRLAGFPNPLQQLAKSRLAGYAVAKAERAAKIGNSGERSAQSQVRSQQHDPFFSGQGPQRGDNSFVSIGAAYRLDASSSSSKSAMYSNFGLPLSQQFNQGDQLYHRERASYNAGFGTAPVPDAPLGARRVESTQQYSSPTKAGQLSQYMQPATAASSREILLQGLQRTITEAEESSLAAHDSSSFNSMVLPISDLAPPVLKVSAMASSPLSFDSAWSSVSRIKSNIERIGPSDPLPWKERPVHIHTVTTSRPATSDSAEVSKKTPPGLHITEDSTSSMGRGSVDCPPHLAINRRARAMVGVASQWWGEDKRPDADLRKHLQAIADKDLSENSGLKNEQWPVLGAKSSQNAIPEGYCANHLLILLLGSLHDYLVDSPNEQRAMFGSFVEVPEWCVEKGTPGLTSFFGEDWGVPPQRVGRDPRYRPLMHDPRFMVSYDEQEFWNRSGEQWTHARRYR